MTFLLKFGDEIKEVRKIGHSDFTPYHRTVLNSMAIHQKQLSFSDDKWNSIYLGSGEEKAVYCISDHNNKVFAVELIDERHYLNGRFIGGEYFFNIYPSKMKNKKLTEKATIGLTFTGLVKTREFVWGFEWARFQFNFIQKSFWDSILTTKLQNTYRRKYLDLSDKYKDVHERNVMFEIRGPKDKGVNAVIRDYSGKLRRVKIGLQAVDVR